MSIHIMVLVWRRSRFKGGDLLVLLALADFANEDGYCWPSVETLSEKSRMGERNVRKVLRRMEKAGELVRFPNSGPNGVNRYRVVPPSEERELFDLCALCGSSDAIEGGLNRHHILPRCQGGGDLQANLISVCVKCHSLLHERETRKLSELGKILLRDGIEAARASLVVPPGKMTGGHGEYLTPELQAPQTVKDPSYNTKEADQTESARFAKAWIACPHGADLKFTETWAEWRAKRANMRKSLSTEAAIKQLKLLSGFSLEEAIESIDTSIRNDWTGIFPSRHKIAGKSATFA